MIREDTVILHKWDIKKEALNQNSKYLRQFGAECGMKFPDCGEKQICVAQNFSMACKLGRITVNLLKLHHATSL